MSLPESLQTRIASVRAKALMAAGALTALAVVARITNPDVFYRSYLMGFTFVVGLPLASLALVMLHHLTGGRWGFGLRRIFEANTRCLPLVALLFVPIALPGGMNALFGTWMHPEPGDAILAFKAGYLNYGAFIFRAVICFSVWGVLTYFINRWSRRQDETGDESLNRPLRMLSGPGVVLYALAVTVAGWDWGMSLDPHWFSSMYGPLFMISQGLTAFGFAIIISSWLARYKPLSEVMTRKVFHDVGNLTFAFVVLWAYMSVSQYLIIWSANLPEEIPYFLARRGPGFEGLAVILSLFHFLVPFLLLLMRHNKLNSSILVKIAWWILLMRFADLYWHIFPSFHPNQVNLSWINAVVPAALIAIYVWGFLGQLKGRPLLPLHDPRFDATPQTEEAPGHG